MEAAVLGRDTEHGGGRGSGRATSKPPPAIPAKDKHVTAENLAGDSLADAS
jgi:hypothetical protein